VLADIFLGKSDSAEQERLARYQRVAASPETAAALLELTYRNDVRAELQHVHAPTSVVHRRGDRAIPYRLGRSSQRHTGATLVPLDGSAHLLGLAIGKRRRAPCVRCWLPKLRPAWPGARGGAALQPSAKCWRGSRTG
jgi:hypothetical protein